MAWRAMPRCNNMSLRRTKSKVAMTFQRHFRNTDAYLSRGLGARFPATRHIAPGSLDSQGKTASSLSPCPIPTRLNSRPCSPPPTRLPTGPVRSYCRISGQIRPLTIKEAISSIRSRPPTARPRPPSGSASPSAYPAHGILGEEFGALRQRCRLLLGDRSDRRHPLLHPRPAALGHADRADPRRRAAARPDGPALHPRALLERRDRGVLPPWRHDQDHAHARLRRISARRCSPPPAPTSSPARTSTALRRL